MKTEKNNKILELKNSVFIQEIISNGWKPYLVGGYVRDYIMNKPSSDIDIIVVGCEYNDLLILLKKYGTPDLVGESFAVIKFNYNGEIYDISTPRIETKIGDGYKGFDVISNKNITLKEDLFRRDITINSIALDFNGNFYDPYNGLNDIKNKIIKITNINAFTEDPLRILRSCRFSARFGFNIDNLTSNKMLKIKHQINELSRERILIEWYKTQEHAEKDISIMQRYIDLLTEYDMWKEMFPKMKISHSIKIKSLNTSIIFFDLFRLNNFNKLKKYLIQTLKLKINDVNYMLFFQEYYYNMKVENVYKLALLKERFNIKDNILQEFVNIHTLNKGFLNSFLKYSADGFTIDGNDLMEQGFKGSDIAKEKERLELEIFNDKYLK